MNLTNKIVLVTGGSRGIGKAIVADCAKRGAKVFFTYHRNAEAAAQTAAETGATALMVDQADPAAITAMADSLIAQQGTLDILVNNAGITADQFAMLMPLEDWQKVLNVNVTGAFCWVKAAVRPMMTRKSGVIINVASVSGLVGIGGQTNYSASKGALLALTRSLAAELGAYGIRVNAVVPGFIETDMTAKMGRQIKQSNKERILLKRFGTAAEVAGVVSFLASDLSTYIIGQTIVVDGGLMSTVA